MLLNCVSAKVVEFEQLKEEYEFCPDFEKIYEAVKVGPSSEFSKYTLRDGYLFKENRLCVPRTSLRDFLIWKIHVEGLAGHFGCNKIILAVEEQFFWPSLKKNVAEVVAQCRTCVVAKQQK